MKIEERDNPAFYERRFFQGATAVVALAAAVLALVGPLRDIADDLFPKTEPVSWVQVVLDTSSAMEGEFDGETRLDAAAEAVGKAVKELRNQGLGLRRTAGSCDGESEQLVDLGAGHNDDVTEMAQRQTPGGKASIVDAVVGALGEFEREPIAAGSPQSRRLLVLTAGISQCSEQDLGEEMIEALELADISEASKLEVFALGASEQEREELRRFEAVLKDHGTHVDVHAPETSGELNRDAEQAGERAARANEILEEERDAGFYEQQ
ncbi:MAG TPA: vWA domain-containing protein [Solirubrobacterales bacterium]|nr:vWA domain-containing protein [Solirubrobacterales bacterium]